MELKTPLYDCHLEAGGKIVPFAGYLLPVQYGTGVITEHMAVRTKAGLFDVSHMGEVFYEGPEALANLNRVLTNDFTNMQDGQVRYSPMCNEEGGIVDDLIVYRFNQNKYMVVVNASNRHKDAAWMKNHLFGQVTFTDLSDEYAQLALQGPLSTEILSRVCDAKFIPQKYYTFTDGCTIKGIPCIISQTGYTGELGYEIYMASKDAVAMWQLLLSAGGQDLIPCGLGARDTLRLEASMPLYGHEMDDTITPLEAGLSFAVKMKKPDFIGKAALEAKSKPARIRIGLKVTGRGIIREHQTVYANGQEIGQTTSGTHCPFVDHPLAMALVQVESVSIGAAVEVDVRGRRVPAEVVPLPFYKRA